LKFININEWERLKQDISWRWHYYPKSTAEVPIEAAAALTEVGNTLEAPPAYSSLYHMGSNTAGLTGKRGNTQGHTSNWDYD
jgi:hypothetical protein